MITFIAFDNKISNDLCAEYGIWVIIAKHLFMLDKLDAHVKGPFYMDLGIHGFRNCKLM